jgi:hypothetical protein
MNCLLRILPRRSLFPVLLCVLVIASPVIAVCQDTFWDQLTTAERISKSPWWPTKPSQPTDRFTGTASCAECHADIVKSQSKAEMSQTLIPAEKSSLAGFDGKSITVDGFVYKFIKTGNSLSYDLMASKTTAAEPLEWAFGSGAISQAYLTSKGTWYNESHFSYFKEIDALDVTPAQPKIRELVGAKSADSAEVKSAEGRHVTADEARRCFSCHAANVPAKESLEKMIPGVTCEACHGPGGNHIAAVKAGIAQGAGLAFNSGHLRPVDRVDFCGACHGTSLDILTEGSSGLASVRFPAYRLQNSKCWRDDARIQCTSCHDPHQPLSHDAATYDARCLSCHASRGAKQDEAHVGRACPTAVKDCVKCHMPKYEFPEVHHKFTDHQIRVVRAGEAMPS